MISNRVFMLDKHKQPLMSCHPARACELLKNGKAAIWRHQTFTIILKIREGGDTQPLTVKLDPGSRTTGIAVVVDGKRGKRVVWAAHLEHRGAQVKSGLQTRSAQRQRSAGAAHPSPTRALPEPPSSDGLAAAVAGKPDREHAHLDAAPDARVPGHEHCARIGASGEQVSLAVRHPPLCIRATGRQRRQMTLVDKFGFPRSKAKGSRFVHGFQTGALVSAVVPTGKRQGSYRGRLAVKVSGGFTVAGTPDVGWRCCRKLQSADGYDYKKGEAAMCSRSPAGWMSEPYIWESPWSAKKKNCSRQKSNSNGRRLHGSLS